MSGVLITHERLQGRPYTQWGPVLIDGPLEGIPGPGSGHLRARIIGFIPASLRTNSGCISLVQSLSIWTLWGHFLCNFAMYKAAFYARSLVNGEHGVQALGPPFVPPGSLLPPPSCPSPCPVPVRRWRRGRGVRRL